MHTVVILGAGELGATLARRIAGREGARRVVLVDPDEGKARGKALDIRQSGPVDGFDVQVEGAATADAFAEPDVLVAADHPELAGAAAADRLAAMARAIRPAAVVIALPRPAAAIDAVLAAGRPADRVMGSAPRAVEAGLRRRIADAVEADPRAVTLALLGLPPDAMVVPHGSVCIAGAPLDAVAPAALRQAVEAARARTPGPAALAAAASAVIAALEGPRPTVLAVMARGEAGAGLGRVTLAWPRRVSRGRLGAPVEVALEPWERVALVNAAEGRLAAGPRPGRA